MGINSKTKRKVSVHDDAIFFIQERSGDEHSGGEKLVGEGRDRIVWIWEGNVQVCIGKEVKVLGAVL